MEENSPKIIFFIIGIVLLSNYLDECKKKSEGKLEQLKNAPKSDPKNPKNPTDLKSKIKSDLEMIELELADEVESQIDEFSEKELLKTSETGKMSNQLKNIVESDISNHGLPEANCSGFMSSSYYALGEDYDILKYEDVASFSPKVPPSETLMVKDTKQFSPDPKGTYAKACSFGDKIYAEFNQRN